MSWCSVATFVVILLVTNCKSTANEEMESMSYHKYSPQITLVCRDDTTLVVGVESSYKDNKTHMLTLKRKEPVSWYSAVAANRNFMIDKPIVVVDHLKSNTKYTISLVEVAGEQHYMTALENFMDFTTLRENYVPGKVAKLYAEEFKISADGNGIDVVIRWTPNEDRSCAYNLFYHSTDSDDQREVVKNFEINEPEKLYRHELKNLAFGNKYKIGIEAVNTRNASLKSDFLFVDLTIPSCLEFSKRNVTLCRADRLENITVTIDHIAGNMYRFNVSWEKPRYPPHNYTLKMIDSDKSINIETVFLNGSINSIELKTDIHGSDYEIRLTANFNGGISTNNYRLSLPSLPHDDIPIVKIVSLVSLLGFALTIIALAVFTQKPKPNRKFLAFVLLFRQHSNNEPTN